MNITRHSPRFPIPRQLRVWAPDNIRLCFITFRESKSSRKPLNISQDLGEKLAIFGRVNGVSGHTATINQSYVLGAVYNNPLDRNPLDQIGLAFAYNKIDEDAVGSKLNHDSEKI